MLVNWEGEEEKQKEGKYEKSLKCGKGNGQKLGEELPTIKPKVRVGDKP